MAKMKVSKLLDVPEKWIKGNLSLDFNNEGVDPSSKKAVKWCLAGAIHHCYPEHHMGILIVVDGYIRKTYPGEIGLNSWNDDRRRTFDEVINLVKFLDI